MTFLQLYGDELDTELGTTDRSQRFTLVRRKAAINKGQRVFNERAGCFVKRGTIALVDDQQEYDIEVTLTDYLRPSKTSASLKRVGASSTDYVEGPGLPYKAEEELNQTRPNWRAESAGVPECLTFREDGGSTYVVLVPAPDIPATETWTLLWPYIAQPADMTDDTHEPWGNASPRIALRPYHQAIVHFAAAELEKLRKNWEGVERQMKLFGALVSAYMADQKPANGSRVRVAVDYRRRLRSQRPPDPTR